MPNKLSRKINNVVTADISTAVKYATRKSFLELQGKELLRRLRVRTQTGKVVDKRGRLEKIEPISDKTKAIRKKYRQNLDPKTKPNKSNLTATGTMLRSLKVSVRGLVIEILPKLKKMRTLTGKASSKTVDEVITYHMEGTNKMPARPFFQSSIADLNALRRKIRQEIFKGLRL
jgi:hypothetical protein